MSGTKKSDFKKALRAQASRKARGSKYELSTHKEYRESVEQGLNELRKVSAQGGDARGKRIRSELEYLLNNYLPKYDARIEHLIDEWRTCGDPSYDPQIRVRFRTARREHMNKSVPL